MAAALGAAALTVQPVAASAQETCVTEDEVAGLMIFLAPSLIDTVRERCSGHVARDGFLAVGSEEFAARYGALRETAWPRAKAALFKLGEARSSRARREAEELAGQPDAVLQPLFEEEMADRLAGSIKPSQCARIERMLEAIAPVDPQVAASIVGVVTGLVGVDNPPVCPPA